MASAESETKIEIVQNKTEATYEQEIAESIKNPAQSRDRKRETLLLSPDKFENFLGQAVCQHGRLKVRRDVINGLHDAISETKSRIADEQALLTQAKRQVGIGDNELDSVSINDLQVQGVRLQENLLVAEEFFGANSSSAGADMAQTDNNAFTKGEREKSLQKLTAQLNEFADIVAKLIGIFRKREGDRFTPLIESDKLSLMSRRVNSLRSSLSSKKLYDDPQELILTLSNVAVAINTIGELSHVRNKTMKEDFQSLRLVRTALDDISLFIDGITRQDIDFEIKKVLRKIGEISTDKKNFLSKKMNALSQYQK